MGPIPK
jgi:hypothetical protein